VSSSNLSFLQKPYSRGLDFSRLIDLVKARPKQRLTDFPSIPDLQEMLISEDPRLNIRLWEDTREKLIGFTLLEDYKTWAFLVMEVASASPARVIERQMIDWGEEIVRNTSRERHSPFPMEVHGNADNREQIASLESLGFERVPGGVLSLSRSLAEPIPDPCLPPGFVIRPSAGEQEAEEWVRLHRLAWGTENMTVAARRSMLQTPFYDPSLDLVAVAPDGSLAAYCVCWFSAEENSLTGRKNGYTDPIATHPAYQRRGLATALILTGLQLLKARGLETARMGTARENLGMLHTAEGAGFRIESETLWYSKTISAA